MSYFPLKEIVQFEERTSNQWIRIWVALNTSPCKFLVGVDEDSCLSPFFLWFATTAHVLLQSVWDLSFSAAILQTAVMTQDDSALTGVLKLATNCLVYLQWVSHWVIQGDLKMNQTDFSVCVRWNLHDIHYCKGFWTLFSPLITQLFSVSVFVKGFYLVQNI